MLMPRFDYHEWPRSKVGSVLHFCPERIWVFVVVFDEWSLCHVKAGLGQDGLAYTLPRMVDA